MKREDELNRTKSFDPQNSLPTKFQKDFIEILIESYQEKEKEDNKFSKFFNAGFKSGKKKFNDIKNKTDEIRNKTEKIINSAANATPNASLSLTNPINKSVRKKAISHVKADLFSTKEVNPNSLEIRRSSNSSESSTSEISNDEKLKETIRQFSKASDSVYNSLNQELNNMAKIDLVYVNSRVSMDLANEPEIIYAGKLNFFNFDFILS